MYFSDEVFSDDENELSSDILGFYFAHLFYSPQ